MAALPSALEICGYDDEQLDKYLEENGRIVHVTDPQNLPASFVQRLRDRGDAEKQPASQPVDMDEVAAKLMQTLTRSGRRRIPSPDTDVSLDSEDMLEKEVQKEEDAYDQLVEEGGRPLYKIDMLRTVSENPDAYTDLLQSFTGLKEKDHRKWWCVFSLQRRGWKSFLWAQKMKRKTEARLAAHNKLAETNRTMVGVTEPFVFIMDKDKQDKLTTWMEYLEHECSIYVQNGYRMEQFLKHGTGTRAGTMKWIIDQIPAIKKEMTDEANTEIADGTAARAVNDTSSEAVKITTTEEKPQEPPQNLASSPSVSSSRKRRREDNDNAPGAPIQKSTETSQPAPKRSRASKPAKAASVLAKPQLAAPSSPPAATQPPAPRRSARLAAKAIPNNVDADIPVSTTKPAARAKAKAGPEEKKRASSSRQQAAPKSQKKAATPKSRKRR
ncbi:hypothetical protein F503_08388 [Ophiostoma piceae UAMH 11346]|uniref:Uncharacterized protein n=1 Tax=Ophiostoma piceae (strain UAMH 11346) TaxID=1262450 RepID=S3BZA5_OPHP1|nr:hypothetical protein F503_08388 [Ophiostoma piceae UAMH 11346]